MKKRLVSKKLSLHRETLQNLEDARFDQVVGGGPSVNGTCQTVCSCTTVCSFCTK